MISPKKYPKLMLVLLILASIVFIANNKIQLQNTKKNQPVIFKENNEFDSHDHKSRIDGSLDPESEKRMGIFHYNEGNNYLKQANWEQAIYNYRMALNHNKNFEEAYINLSTSYLASKQFAASLKTLSILKEINPKHPLLYYNLACYYALTGNINLSIESLKESVKNGYKNLDTLNIDPDLKNLRSDIRFKELHKQLLTIIPE